MQLVVGSVLMQSLQLGSTGWGCMEPVVWTTLGTGPAEDVVTGLEFPVGFLMWSLVGQQDWKKSNNCLITVPRNQPELASCLSTSLIRNFFAVGSNSIARNAPWHRICGRCYIWVGMWPLMGQQNKNISCMEANQRILSNYIFLRIRFPKYEYVGNWSDRRKLHCNKNQQFVFCT